MSRYIHDEDGKWYHEEDYKALEARLKEAEEAIDKCAFYSEDAYKLATSLRVAHCMAIDYRTKYPKETK